MTIIQNAINLGTAADAGDGDNIRVGGSKVNLDIGNIIASLNAVISAIGLATDTSVNLGSFSGTTIADNLSVKAALQAVETYVESLSVLDPGYTQNATVTFPTAGDSLEVAISKLHRVVSYLQGLDALRFAGTFDASLGLSQALVRTLAVR